MVKPPASPPSSDIETADSHTESGAKSDKSTHGGTKREERARRESKGRPADTKR